MEDKYKGVELVELFDKFDIQQATEVIRQMAKALEDIKNCATYAAPPKDFNGVLGYEARVPIEFIDILEKALEAAKPWLEEK